MELLIEWVLPCVYSFGACVGFCLLFNIHGPGMIICGAGGALGWLVYLLMGLCWPGNFLRYLIAALVITLYSELMARLRHCPVTSYLIVALLPLVPGGGIYYAMLHCIAGDNHRFLTTLLETVGIAGALALGVLLSSSVVRLFLSFSLRARKYIAGVLASVLILSAIIALALAGAFAPLATLLPSILPTSPDVSVSAPSASPSDTPGSASTDSDSYESSVPAMFFSPLSYDFSQPVPECPLVDNSYFADAAFVGDSRTEGFWLYSKVNQGKLISFTGLTVFGAIRANVINIDGRMGTVLEALSAGNYSKIYLAFGINELGYGDTESFYRAYCQLIDSIRDVHPDALIYVQTLIPVNNERAAATGHKRYVNCDRVREFNEIIRRVANDKRVPLLDVYSAFAVDGQLPEEASRDGVHLLPEYCEKQLDFYRRHAIPTGAFAGVAPAGTPSAAPEVSTTPEPPGDSAPLPVA